MQDILFASKTGPQAVLLSLVWVCDEDVSVEPPSFFPDRLVISLLMLWTNKKYDRSYQKLGIQLSQHHPGCMQLSSGLPLGFTLYTSPGTHVSCAPLVLLLCHCSLGIQALKMQVSCSHCTAPCYTKFIAGTLTSLTASLIKDLGDKGLGSPLWWIMSGVNKSQAWKEILKYLWTLPCRGTLSRGFLAGRGWCCFPLPSQAVQ